MKIDKRRPITVDVNGIKNNSKYFNMMNWKGIIENNNIYTIDQNSFEDCKNIYVDDEERLVSRDPLIENSLSEEVLPLDYNLIDIVNIGEDKIYVSQDIETNEYRIIIMNNITYSDNENIIVNMTNYNICTIEHYAICFNDSDEGAKVYDTLNKTEGWQPLSNFIEVPVIKRVVGSVVTDLSSNRNYLDRNHYKEEYLWTNELQTDLPNGTSSVEITSEGGTNLELTLTDSNILPEYRVYRKLNITKPDDYYRANRISKVNNIVTIAYTKYVDISYDNGVTFERVYYPNDDLLRGSASSYGATYIATLSDDGKCFFYVGCLAVYKYRLSDKQWYAIYVDDDVTLKIKDNSNPSVSPWYYNCYNYHFLSENQFSFVFDVVEEVNNSYTHTLTIFGMGVNLQLYRTDEYHTSAGVGKLGVCYIKSPSYPECGFQYLNNITSDINQLPDRGNGHKVKVVYNPTYNITEIIILARVYLAGTLTDTLISILVKEDRNPIYETFPINITNANITNVTINVSAINSTATKPKESICIEINGIPNTSSEYYDANKPWTVSELYLGKDIYDYKVSYSSSILLNFEVSRTKLGDSPLLKLYTNTYCALIINENSLQEGNLKFFTYDNFGPIEVTNPIELSGDVLIENELMVNIQNDTIILTRNMSYGEIYVNDLASGDLATFTFEYGESEPFVEVPDISYSDTELYLAFDKTLRITNNIRDEDDLYFNLPSVNDQSFIDKITALKNISTTEVAVFFEDNIYICSKVYDETLSRFRYDYYRTKLSTGVRLGDSVINTLEGSFTVFPTRRGLAALNYQAFMATTDQVITYVSDNISNYWTEFYDNSQRTNHPIHIMQWRTRLIITNGSYEMILFDLEKASWWRWEVPVNIRKCLTDQITLGLISNKLYEFKANDLYYDLPNTPSEQMIEWNMISQQLHMNAPDNYKNLRQLVFQLYDNNSNIENIYTILATIKLYRKRAEVRLPETIKFKIDELRTFVKRFNYWKVNEIQWALSSDAETHTPIKLQLNGISVKYEIGEEVR